MKRTIIILFVFLLLTPVIKASSDLRTANNWNKFETIDGRLAALQLSDDQLSNTTTEKLLQLCLDFPFSIDFILYGGNDEGIERMIKEFNGYQEFLTRKDAISVLISEFEKLPAITEKSAYSSSKEKGDLSLRLLIVEYLMIRENIINKMSEEQLNRLSNAVENNIKTISRHTDIFSAIHDNPMRRMIQKNPKTQKLAASTSWQNATVYTPKGSLIGALKYMGTDYTDSEKASIKAQVESAYSPAVVMEPASRKYNCHAYAWHLSQGETEVVWINAIDNVHTENGYYLRPYWQDGSFVTTSSVNCTQILYPGDHSALRYNSSSYISKWGEGPVVLHSPTNVPSGYITSGQYYYYKRNFTIEGPALVTSTATYYVSGLTSGCSVSWSISDTYYSQNCMQVNYPNTNQCTITRSSSKDLYQGTLTATVTRNGKTIAQLTKTISAYTGFKGTYTSSFGSGQYTAPNPIFAASNSGVTIYSPNLIGATLSYSGDIIPTFKSHVDNRLDVSIPSTGATLVVNVSCLGGGSYTIPIIRANIPYGMNVNFSGESLIITLDESALEEQNWSLEIANIVTGEKAITKTVTGNSVSLNTSGWKQGLYAVRVTIGKEVLTEKIQVK
ncbi:MAG: hypothetical protein IJ633_08005 [Prevotella sp.]|nr:hypothetical protein [Prevotella sp.]